MPDLATLFAAMFGHVAVHHPVLVLPLHGYQSLVGVMPWGA